MGIYLVFLSVLSCVCVLLCATVGLLAYLLLRTRRRLNAALNEVPNADPTPAARAPWPAPTPAPPPPAMPLSNTGLSIDAVLLLLDHATSNQKMHLETLAHTISSVTQAAVTSILAPNPSGGPNPPAMPPAAGGLSTFYAGPPTMNDVSDPTDAWLPPIRHREGAVVMDGDGMDTGIPGFSFDVPAGVV